MTKGEIYRRPGEKSTDFGNFVPESTAAFRRGNVI
jgi:hypothetical protein